MAELPLGVSYKEAATRCKRILKNPGAPLAKERILNSLINQCRLAEGEKSTRELTADITAKHTSSPTFSGAGNKSCGFGKGHKLGGGRFRYYNGKWEEV